HLARHVAVIREVLESLGSVTESLDGDAIEDIARRQGVVRWRDDSNLDPLRTKGNSQSQNERPGRIAGRSWKIVRDVEDLHRGGRACQGSWRARSSSSCRRISRISARCPAIDSPSRPVAKKIPPRI